MFDTNEERHVFLVLKDIHHRLNDPVIIARLKSIALKTIYNDGFHVTVFVVNTELVIPPELEKMITIIDFPMPDHDNILTVIRDYAQDFSLTIDEDVQNELAISLCVG